MIKQLAEKKRTYGSVITTKRKHKIHHGIPTRRSVSSSSEMVDS
jgi:hypothetical protein